MFVCEMGIATPTIGNPYNFVYVWKSRGRERDLFSFPITTQTRVLLRDVGFLKFYEEVNSLKGNTNLLF
jgi:hypothetical protein